ncbi:MAG: glycogen debranching enzyme, partial [Lachnospiraceae bacterium]|nr:glycogen debranching enzyme [Lachnospiraceae bacterium]
WNGRYRDDMREYLKGGYWKAYDAMYRMLGSPDMYDPDGRGCNASINFINCHDGFTLYDLYSYNEKHNEMNGWDNTDGSNDNQSWNCGVEGPTDDPEVNELRKKLCKNAIAALMMSRGIPMFLAGDEFLNSQFGNNNPYCQDNEISWLNWNDLEINRDHFEFVKFMIRFRKEHPIICRPGSDQGAIGLEEITVYEPYDQSKVAGIIYSDHYEDGRPDIAAIMINVYWEPQPVKLPRLTDQMHWYVVADTSKRHVKTTIACPAEDLVNKPYIRNKFRIRGRNLHLEPRSIMILTAE